MFIPHDSISKTNLDPTAQTYLEWGFWGPAKIWIQGVMVEEEEKVEHPKFGSRHRNESILLVGFWH